MGAARADQLQRMSELGVIPTFGIFQMMQWGDLLDGQLYESKYGARWSPVGDAAAADFEHLHQSYHNDGNISPQNPLASAQAAITRRSNLQSPDGECELAAGNLHGPEQQVSLDLALRAITINAAYILARDDQIGSIEVGKLADFTQLAADPYAVNPAKLATEAAVIGTWLGGRPTDPSGFAASLRATPASSSAAMAAGITGFNCDHGPGTSTA